VDCLHLVVSLFAGSLSALRERKVVGEEETEKETFFGHRLGPFGFWFGCVLGEHVTVVVVIGRKM
jgi:hypothetical protein